MNRWDRSRRRRRQLPADKILPPDVDQIPLFSYGDMSELARDLPDLRRMLDRWERAQELTPELIAELARSTGLSPADLEELRASGHRWNPETGSFFTAPVWESAE